MQTRGTIGNIVISKISDKNASQHMCWNTFLKVFIHLFIMLQFSEKENTCSIVISQLIQRTNHRLNLNNLYVKLIFLMV